MNFTPNEITLMRNYKEAQELIEQQATNLKQAFATIEQMREAVETFLKQYPHMAKGYLIDALDLQPCPDASTDAVLNKVRADAIREFAVEMERSNAELPLPFAHWYADRIEKGEA